MSIALSFRQEADYLFVKARGDWTAENAERMIAAIHDELTRRGLITRGGLTHLFLDTRGISKPDYEVTRFITGQCWAQTFDYRFKTALWSRPETYNGFAETVALNRGANVKVLFDEAAALNWLLDKASKAA
jgi:hypothetical protein